MEKGDIEKGYCFSRTSIWLRQNVMLELNDQMVIYLGAKVEYSEVIKTLAVSKK